MKHVRINLEKSHANWQDVESETGIVHYEGCGLIGSHTICGHTDRVEMEWEETTKRVNCRGCLAVRDHVLGKQPTASRP